MRRRSKLGEYNMYTAMKGITPLLIPLLILLGVVACDKKCQAPAEQRYKTFVDEKWRLVETTDPDPGMKSLSNTNFLIMTFTKEYTVAVNRVENNKEFETPVLVGEYNVDPSRQLLNVVYQTPQAEPEGGESGTTTQATAKTSAVQYVYDLSREFELYNNATGYYYRFVPYTGVVYPDNQCTF